MFKKIILAVSISAMMQNAEAGYYLRGQYHPFIWGECKNLDLSFWESESELIYGAMCDQRKYCNSSNFFGAREFRLNDAWLESSKGKCTAKANVLEKNTGRVATLEGLVIQ